MKYLDTLLCSEALKARILILVVVCVLLLIRRTDAFTNPQFWAEDGTVFFLQQYEHGLSAILKSYAGYLHLMPRLIALFSDTFFSYSAAPVVYNVFSVVVAVLVCLSLYSQRLHFRYKGLCALSLVLVPHYEGVVFVNITNLQWILCVLLVTLILRDHPDSRYGNIWVQYLSDVGALFICGLTGPFLVLIAPLFVWKWCGRRTAFNGAVLGVVAIVVAVQMLCILALKHGERSLHFDLSSYSQFIGNRVFGGLLLGDFSHSISDRLLTVLYWVTAFGVYRVCSEQRRRYVIVFFYTHLVMLAAAIYKVGGDPQALIPPGNASRYLYVPFVMVAWSLIVALEDARRWRRSLVVVALLSILCSSVSLGFRRSFVDYNWQFYSSSIGKKDVVIPINPKGWVMEVRARGLVTPAGRVHQDVDGRKAIPDAARGGLQETLSTQSSPRRTEI